MPHRGIMLPRRQRPLLSALAVGALLAAQLPTACASDPPTPTGLQTQVVFDGYSPFSSAAEIERRLLSPLQALGVEQAVAKSGETMREQSIDLAKETFTVYVPATKPAQGYALLVFTFPWNNPSVPPRWLAELDRHGMILVMPDQAGNDENVLDRREPLALLAAQNILRRYPVDARRVYVGGLSGGSRVALRLALGYPDLFRGALLNAGSGPIGDAHVRLPPVELMHRFQESSRVVFITGENDKTQLDRDERGRKSLQAWCVFDYATISVPSTGHEVLPADAFDRGLAALEAHDVAPPQKIAACRTHYEQELNVQLHQAEVLEGSGAIAAARDLLRKIDVRFGGLAAPRSVDLARAAGR